MKTIQVLSSNIVSPLGHTSQQNFESVQAAKSAIKQQPGGSFAAEISSTKLSEWTEGLILESYSKFEKLAILSISDAISGQKELLQNPKTLFILSTTKGNIDLLIKDSPSQFKDLNLAATAQKIAKYFKANNTPVVVSTACISGLMSIIVAQRLIRSGKYDHAVICGADILSDFVQSGFQSFLALSNTVCKPFDIARDGINLGEAAATLVLSVDKSKLNIPDQIVLGEGASSNDANHISGPSRSGEELSQAINQAIGRSGLSSKDIGFVSAHGTATIYNDEMESKAFHLSNLSETPVNSLKSYFGHTLGAAGLLESIISIEAIKNNIILPTLGWEKSGVSMPLNLSNQLIYKPVRNFLKTTSGFGGCNAALIFSKTN